MLGVQAKKNTEKSPVEKIEQSEYGNPTSTENCIVLEQLEQLVESDDKDNDECIPLIEENASETS